jgi:hypothetical protein
MLLNKNTKIRARLSGKRCATCLVSAADRDPFLVRTCLDFK